MPTFPPDPAQPLDSTDYGDFSACPVVVHKCKCELVSRDIFCKSGRVAG